MGCRLKIAGKTDKGRRRQKNEDFLVIEKDLGLIVVADGMGGHASGEVASQLAASLCAQQLRRSLQSGHVPVFYHVPKNPDLDNRSLLLGDCVKFANQAVFEAAQTNPANHNMGTTLVAALWLSDRVAVANVGDSRMYLVRGGALQQCTVDHSFVQDQVARGLLKPEDAEKSDLRNMLTRSIGVAEDVEVDLFELELEKDDFVLLCSDGLTKMLDDDQILSAFEGETDPFAVVDRLIKRANDAGGGDNVTVAIGRVEESVPRLSGLTNAVKGVFKRRGD